MRTRRTILPEAEKQIKGAYIDSYVDISYKISTSTTSSPKDSRKGTRVQNI